MRRRLPLGVLLSVLAFLAVAAGVWGLSQILVRSLLLEPETDGASRAVGVLRIQGGIFDARGTVGALERLAKRPEVKAVLIRIESPGGAVAPTQEIYEEVLRLRRSGLKVVASMGGVAASGGYYVAAAADKIYANPGTITGSIGVVMVLPNVERVLGAVGLQVNVIKSGPGKDVASPFRAMTDRDREILQRVVDDTYSQFVRAVAEGRKMPGEKVRELADGSIFSGERAKELGLVDALGTERDAVMEAARLGGIPGEPRLIEMRPETGFWGLLSGMARSWTGWLGVDGTRFLGDAPAVLEYMWRLS
ncbi:MAG: signal peptide peptidase SppA [Candidatus Tectomicrobia bacterium]|uniref:Signal peptide peptidase SppA n=1 Tax=Tectimicrobiota bacterium TaxID=2528274 RepID=A0A932ZVW6_UNCTE|nr:signal peptide peptidase SppA [Candidatus Tectomicrobia bacterium]